MDARINARGIPVVTGAAFAPVRWVVRPQPISLDSQTVPKELRDHEVERFVEAADNVTARLLSRAEKSVGSSSDLLRVAAAMATDPAWRSATTKLIQAGTPADSAATQTIADIARKFVAAGDTLAERVTDLIDVRDRVVAEIHGMPEGALPELDKPTILFCDDLAPADAGALDPKYVKALVCRGGGPTSHFVIVSRQLGIPCIISAKGIDNGEDGELALVDGANGHITINPDAGHARSIIALDEARHQAEDNWEGPACTKDGIRIYLYGNVQDRMQALQARKMGADGVGLLRTELTFLGTRNEPNLDAQIRAYKSVIDVFPDKRFIARTLDAGSDKPVVWAGTQPEENPALGVRGLRTILRKKEVLLHQLDALAEVSAGRKEPLRVMAPMVSTLDEAQMFADLVRERGMSPGIMIEVPALAFLADPLYQIVDFTSLGTNDLTQYLMAADRTNPYLASYLDAWQPAILTLIAHVARAAARHGKQACVCGEAAADPVLASVLTGMGVHGLSMAPSAIKTVGSYISQLNLDTCKRAAIAVIGNDPGDMYGPYTGAFSAVDARERALKIFNEALSATQN